MGFEQNRESGQASIDRCERIGELINPGGSYAFVAVRIGMEKPDERPDIDSFIRVCPGGGVLMADMADALSQMYVGLGTILVAVAQKHGVDPRSLAEEVQRRAKAFGANIGNDARLIIQKTQPPAAGTEG